MAFDALQNLKNLVSNASQKQGAAETRAANFTAGIFNTNVQRSDSGTTRKVSGTTTPGFNQFANLDFQKNVFDLSNIFSGLGAPNTIARRTNLQNIETLNSNQLGFAAEVSNAFKTILQPNTNTAGVNDNVSGGTKDNPGKDGSFTETARAGFADIFQQIGPGGIVAGALILGVVLLKK